MNEGKFERKEIWQEFIKEGKNLSMRKVVEKGLEISTRKKVRKKIDVKNSPGEKILKKMLMLNREENVENVDFRRKVLTNESLSDWKTSPRLENIVSVNHSSLNLNENLKKTLQVLEDQGLVTSKKKMFEEGRLQSGRKMTPGKIEKKRRKMTEKLTPQKNRSFGLASRGSRDQKDVRADQDQRGHGLEQHRLRCTKLGKIFLMS